MHLRKFSSVLRLSTLTIAAGGALSCTVLFDLERGELALPDDSGAPSGDASTDPISPKGDSPPPRDVTTDASLDTDRPDMERPDVRWDTLADAGPADAMMDVPLADGRFDVVPADTTIDVPRADTAIDVAPVDTRIDTTPVDVAPIDAADALRLDARDASPADATVDVPRVDATIDAIVDSPSVPDSDGPRCDGPGGLCGCSAATCSAGCCDNDVCVPFANQDDGVCGVGGESCSICSTGRACSKSPDGCVTWCGLRSAPSGVAAGDYACLDFDTGLPSSGAWTSTVDAPSSLALTTSVFVSAPNGMEAVSGDSTSSPNTSRLRFTTPSGAVVKSVSATAAMNTGFWQNLGGADRDVLCAVLPSGFHSEACLTFAVGGLMVRYNLFQGSGPVTGECPVSGSLPANMWTNVEVHLDAVTGLVQAMVNGVVTNCQATDPPVADTVGSADVGLYRGLTADIGFTMRYDNVEVTVRR